jgi:hypothetical protein
MLRNLCGDAQDVRNTGVSINVRDAMPLKSNLQLEIFDVWGIDFMVEALPVLRPTQKIQKKMFQEIIFPRFGVPRVVISVGGSHFIDKTFRKCLSELGVDHRIATPYHPQTSGQAETSNKQIKNILQKIVNATRKGWKSKLPEAV